jgi:hypothetical protein
MTTRRRLLHGMAVGVGAGVLSAALPRTARADDDLDTVTRRLRADLERHASFGAKFSAGPGDNATAKWVADRLRESGYRVGESSFDAPFFVQRAARLATAGATADVVPQAPVVPSGARGVTARLALVAGEGADVGDVAGRIALVVAPFARHAALFPDRGIGQTVAAAARRGAIAIVIVTTGPSGEAVALNAPEEPFVPVPAAVLAPKLAEPFVAAARAGTEATLIVDGDATRRPCRNVVGRAARGRSWLGISTPRSGWYGCVAERGTGTAVFLELADWALRRFPELSVFVMSTGGHEYFFAGSHRVIGQGPPPANTLCWAHIGATLAARDAEQRDGRWVMLDSADPQRSLMASDSVRDAAAHAFMGLSGLEQAVAIRAQAGELSTFTDRGYTKAFAVIGQHRWFHTVADTLDCVDARLLAPVLRAHQRTIEAVVAGAA